MRGALGRCGNTDLIASRLVGSLWLQEEDCHKPGLQCRAEGKEGEVQVFQLGIGGEWGLEQSSAQVLLLDLVCSFPAEIFFYSERKGLSWLTARTSSAIPGPPFMLIYCWDSAISYPGRKRLSANVLQTQALKAFSRAKETVTQVKQIKMCAQLAWLGG